MRLTLYALSLAVVEPPTAMILTVLASFSVDVGFFLWRKYDFPSDLVIGGG